MACVITTRPGISTATCMQISNRCQKHNCNCDYIMSSRLVWFHQPHNHTQSFQLFPDYRSASSSWKALASPSSSWKAFALHSNKPPTRRPTCARTFHPQGVHTCSPRNRLVRNSWADRRRRVRIYDILRSGGKRKTDKSVVWVVGLCAR